MNCAASIAYKLSQSLPGHFWLQPFGNDVIKNLIRIQSPFLASLRVCVEIYNAHPDELERPVFDGLMSHIFRKVEHKIGEVSALSAAKTLYVLTHPAAEVAALLERGSDLFKDGDDAFEFEVLRNMGLIDIPQVSAGLSIALAYYAFFILKPLSYKPRKDVLK